MSMKIAPAPAPINSSLPRIAFLPNQQPVLLIPNNYTGRYPMPIRVSPNNERAGTSHSYQTVQFLQPKMPKPAKAHEDPMRMTREESGLAESFLSTQQRRDLLKRKIQERPSKQYLIRKHILLTDPLVEPFVGEKTHQLRKQAVVSNLNRKLKTRPGPLDLVTAKILQADAELEEAIKEGRLLFPSSRRELESPSPSIPQAPSPSVLLSTLRISKQESLREEEEARAQERANQAYQDHYDQGMMDGDEPEEHRVRKYGRMEARAQPHPYARMDPQQPSPSKARLKGPQTKDAGEYTAIPADNFEAMMKQQELFIEWRTRPEIEGHHQGGTQPHEDGGESDSGETIPYGDEDEPTPTATTTITYRVFPETPAEAPDPVQINHSKNAPRCASQQQFRGPIFSLSDIKKTDLMQECRDRGLKCGGDKTTIMNRLEGLKDEIIAKFKEEQARLEATMENSPQISSSERALSNTSSSSSPSTIMDEFDSNGMARIDESISSRRHSLPSNNPQQSIARSVLPPSRHLSMSTGSHPPVAAPPTISSLSFSQANPLNGQMERKIQMKTANGEIFYATLPSADDLPIPRDGKPIGCKIAIVNGKPVLQFQQPSGPIEPGTVGAAGIRDTLLFAQNGSGGQVTLGPQKERSRANSLNRKFAQTGEVNSISSLLRSNSSTTSLPVMVQRTARTQSTSSASSLSSKIAKREHVPLPRESSRKPSKSPSQPPPQPPPPPPPREPSVQPHEHSITPSPQPVLVPEPVTPEPRPLTDAEQVFAHVNAINKLLDRPEKLTLDAKTVLEHEQALRGQQRLIDQLQKELKKSYTALKIQQQLILSAKRAQTAEIAKMTNNKLKNIGEAWLFELNMKRLHKSNSNFFLTHEQQTSELQNMTEEQKKIQKQHINIQISEASDSAIKDITKFISANPKTALLIVQLLKKYQNEKTAQPTQTFADIPPFEASEKTPTSARPQSTHTAADFCLVNQPGPSNRVEAIVHDSNGNEHAEAIVIDDESHDEETVHQRLRLSAPPMRIMRRKEQRGNNIQVDMEAIFRTVLDGSKTGNQPLQQSFGSPSDSNFNKTIEHSPSHSVSSIPSSSSMAGLGPSTSSSSPCSSSTPPDMIQTMMQTMMQGTGQYGNNNVFPAHCDGSMDYLSSHPLPYESTMPCRPYVRDGAAGDDNNPTDILMEAVESSGIVDDNVVGGVGGCDEPMPSSSHSMHHLDLNHEHLQMMHDDTLDMNDHLNEHLNEQEDELAMMNGEMANDVFDGIFSDEHSIFNDFDAFEEADFNRLHDLDIDDLLDVLKADTDDKRSPNSKKVSYNGTEELNKVLGQNWMNMQASTSHEQPMHPMQLDVPSSSLLPHDSAFEDVFRRHCASSHVGRSQSTSSKPKPKKPKPPPPDLIMDMTWLNDEQVRAALSPKAGAFNLDDRFDFSPNNS